MKTKFKTNKGISKMNIPFVRSKTSTAGITLIALVITIVLNSSYLAMDRMNKIEKI